jgi:hypothetical protein
MESVFRTLGGILKCLMMTSYFSKEGKGGQHLNLLEELLDTTLKKARAIA